MDLKPPEHIKNYVNEYVGRFNKIYPQLGNLTMPAASLYAQPITSTAIFKASDGFALFYLPPNQLKERPEIIYVDCDTIPLAQLVQSVTVNYIKVLLPPTEPIRADFSNGEQIFNIPPDLPIDIMQQVKYQTLNPELTNAVLRDGNLEIVGMAITPTVHFLDGVPAEILPTRYRVFSPVVFLPTNEVLLQYQWVFADILWKPDEINLDSDAAINYAESDLQVLRLGFEVGVHLNHLYQNPYEAVAQNLMQACHRFEMLINDPKTIESDIQTFLENPSHRFILSPIHKAIFSQKPLGGFKKIPDFTVLLPDGEYHFIEIENPHREIYQLKGEEMSAHLTHALTQVLDWLQYVNDNRDTVRREDGLATIYEPSGEVIAGRDKHLGHTAARRFQFYQSENRRIKIKTYDRLLLDAYSYIETLRSFNGQT